MREFRRINRNGKDQIWTIEIDSKDSSVYITRWGILNGKFQETRDRPGSCGVKGHSDFQTPSMYAIFCMDREIRKKIEKGYIEYINGKPILKHKDMIDFTKLLPKRLTFYKPKKKISDKALKKMEEKKRIVWTLKRDGMMHIIVKRNDNIEIYSRRMDLVTEKFPHIIKSIKKLKLPNNTIMLGEMCLLNKNGNDNFKGVSSICRSDVELSLAYQGLANFPKRKKNKKILGLISYYVFDIPFYNGKDFIFGTNVRERFILIRNVFRKLDNRLRIKTGLDSNYKEMIYENTLRDNLLQKFKIGPVKLYKTTTSDDIELAKKIKAEGFVAVDVDACYGDKGYSFDGKSGRPDGCWKRKPIFEDEFIITGLYEGSGKNMGRLGGFTIKQIHPKTGKFINCGRCGGGFSDNQRIEFWKEGNKLIGKTIKIEFDSRQLPKDGVYSLRFPIFIGYADKEPEECIAEYLPKG
jgi:ATP-dependent DNA ligase